MKTAIELITEERQRQIYAEGFSLDHDDKHTKGELSAAAVFYAMTGNILIRPISGEEAENLKMMIKVFGRWPWKLEDWKPSEDPIRNLVKAGALIAAEIDRLQRVAARSTLP